MAEDLGKGTHLIDSMLYRPQLAGCYLVRDHDELAIIDTGTHHTVPAILDSIRKMGLDGANVRWVMPTHVHLDHAGGSGSLMQACPNAMLVIHPKGAPHMIDPAKLSAGATAVYGEEAFLRDFGVIEPVDKSRVIAATDGQCFDLGQRKIEFIDTPGHANHHGCLFDQTSGDMFTGDTFGLGYREFIKDGKACIVATTTPVAFDPDAWFDSLERMFQRQPQRACLTHYGAVEQPEQYLEMLRAGIQAHVDIALAEESNDPEGRSKRLLAAVERHLVDSAAGHSGLAENEVRSLLEGDIKLNAQGLEVWLIRRAKKPE